MEELRLCESDYRFMCVVWDNAPLRSHELVEQMCIRDRLEDVLPQQLRRDDDIDILVRHGVVILVRDILRQLLRADVYKRQQ